MERLENCGNRERVAVEELITDGTLTIEHIMPQTLTEEWKRSLGEQWELIHGKYIDTVGNLTLSAYNADYSNLSFTKKKTMPNKGFAYSKLQLNAYIKMQDKWSEDQILARANLLYKSAEQIWPMPETDYANQQEEEWFIGMMRIMILPIRLFLKWFCLEMRLLRIILRMHTRKLISIYTI